LSCDGQLLACNQLDDNTGLAVGLQGDGFTDSPTLVQTDKPPTRDRFAARQGPEPSKEQLRHWSHRAFPELKTLN
jgi:hypothetical protein